jgi:hypothetical protein
VTLIRYHSKQTFPVERRVSSAVGSIVSHDASSKDGGNLRHGVRRRIQQEHSIAALAGKAFHELSFVNDELPLQNRIRHRAHDAHLERLPALIHIIQRVADFFAHRPLD